MKAKFHPIFVAFEIILLRVSPIPLLGTLPIEKQAGEKYIGLGFGVTLIEFG